ncbi:avidin-like [Columba livia]|uniref:avidin-like n=1 Tax=Columba livia TaxID=8932 RepID=UPI0031BB4835
MVQVTPFLLVLSVALVAPGFSARKCPLEGSWRNKEGHILKIWSVDDPTCECDGYYRRNGRYELKERWLYWEDNTIIFGFTVYWSSDFRTTFMSWYRNEGGKKSLQTNWYEEIRVCDNTWKIIRRGTYTFTRLDSCPVSGIVGDSNTDGSTWDAEPLSCINMGQHSQKTRSSAGDFKADGNAWEADPISGSTPCF